jgi:hypothetical protein
MIFDTLSIFLRHFLSISHQQAIQNIPNVMVRAGISGEAKIAHGGKEE